MLVPRDPGGSASSAYGRRAIASISTRKPFGSAPTWTVVRAVAIGEEPGIDGVHRGEVRHVHEEDGGLDHVGESHARRVKHGAEIAQRALRLGLDGPQQQVLGPGIDRPRPEQKMRSPATMAWL